MGLKYYATSYGQDAVEADRAKEEERQLAKLQYHNNLKTQMQSNAGQVARLTREQAELVREQERQRAAHQQTVNKVKERKLQQLK